MAWSSEQFVLHSHADLMGIMEITMVWEVGDPRKAFLYLIEQPCTSHAGVRAVLQAHQATPTFGDLSLFSPPSGIFFPQISTWVALRGKKKGRKEGNKDGRESGVSPNTGCHSSFCVKPVAIERSRAETADTQCIVLGSGRLLNKLTSSASSQMSHNLKQIHTFPLGSLGSHFYLCVHLAYKCLFFSFFIAVELIYNAVPISAAQQSDV